MFMDLPIVKVFSPHQIMTSNAEFLPSIDLFLPSIDLFFVSILHQGVIKELVIHDG